MVTAHRISEQGSTEFGAVRHSGTFIVTEKSGEQTIVANRGGGNMYLNTLRM